MNEITKESKSLERSIGEAIKDLIRKSFPMHIHLTDFEKLDEYSFYSSFVKLEERLQDLVLLYICNEKEYIFMSYGVNPLEQQYLVSDILAAILNDALNIESVIDDVNMKYQAFIQVENE